MTAIPSLSAIIITKNEEKDIEECLRSVADLASDIVLVDSGSTDNTLSIARRYTQRIFHRDWTGFSAQKQFALDQAKGTWVLNIDADERPTPALKAEIRRKLETNGLDANGYDIRFRHYFLGRRLRFGGLAGERHLRLFRKDKATYGKNRVHEAAIVDGAVKCLDGAIDHISYRDLEEYLEKCNRYTSLIAQAKFERGQRFHVWHHLRLPFEFFQRYLLKLGFLDGGPGFVYALLSSFYVWLKFAKLKTLEAASAASRTA